MRVPASTRRAEIYEDKWMTPMIDIVILLLIFLVCAAVGAISESLMPTPLAPGGVVESPLAVGRKEWLTQIWLNLRREGGGHRTIVEMNGRDYDDLNLLREQLTALAEAAPESPVILDIAADVPLGDLIRVWDACRTAKFESINFAADAAKVAQPAGDKDPGSGVPSPEPGIGKKEEGG
jgi:biopolymer transport protein ExbD